MCLSLRRLRHKGAGETSISWRDGNFKIEIPSESFLIRPVAGDEAENKEAGRKQERKALL
jgi:hypothetical protein